VLMQLGDSLLQFIVRKNNGLAVFVVDGLTWVLTSLTSLVLVDQLTQYILRNLIHRVFIITIFILVVVLSFIIIHDFILLNLHLVTFTLIVVVVFSFNVDLLPFVDLVVSVVLINIIHLLFRVHVGLEMSNRHLRIAHNFLFLTFRPLFSVILVVWEVGCCQV
jgi:hypothetical protein